MGDFPRKADCRRLGSEAGESTDHEGRSAELDVGILYSIRKVSKLLFSKVDLACQLPL
jgi:hypothetical protein